MEKKRLAKLEDDNEIEKAPDRFLPTSFSDDLGSNNSGFYELKAVITHKGRASNSGHYIAWASYLNSVIFIVEHRFESKEVSGLVVTTTTSIQ